MTQKTLLEFLEDYEDLKIARDKVKNWKNMILAEYEDGEYEQDGGDTVVVETIRRVRIKRKKKKD